MKKKKITGKLNFKKSVISSFGSSQIIGGGDTIVVDGPSNACPSQPPGPCGSITCEPTWGLSQGTGSECKCK